MNRIQLQAKLSMPIFLQQIGTKALCVAILERTHGSQVFSCAHCGGMANLFVKGRTYNIFQCKVCRDQSLNILGTMLQSSKLPFTLWFLRIYLISHVRTYLYALARKNRLDVSYPCAWLLKFQYMQAMAEPETPYIPFDSAQLIEACLGRSYHG